MERTRQVAHPPCLTPGRDQSCAACSPDDECVNEWASGLMRPSPLSVTWKTVSNLNSILPWKYYDAYNYAQAGIINMPAPHIQAYDPHMAPHACDNKDDLARTYRAHTPGWEGGNCANFLYMLWLLIILHDRWHYYAHFEEKESGFYKGYVNVTAKFWGAQI